VLRGKAAQESPERDSDLSAADDVLVEADPLDEEIVRTDEEDFSAVAEAASRADGRERAGITGSGDDDSEGSSHGRGSASESRSVPSPWPSTRRALSTWRTATAGGVF